MISVGVVHSLQEIPQAGANPMRVLIRFGA